MSSFIMEGAIFQEAKIIKKDPSKAIFRSVIQTCNEINQNGRLYPESVLREGMSHCESRMKRRAFLSELDHPFPQGNETFDSIRQTTVSLKEVSHIIRSYDFKGNHLIGEMETTSTPNGQILFGLLNDKSGVGFSMRGMAELDHLEEHDIIKSPLTVISFDAVSSPSHRSAVVDFTEMRFEQDALVENCNSICINGRCFLPEYFDTLVETKVIKFFERWI